MDMLERAFGSYESIDRAKERYEKDINSLQEELEKTKSRVYPSEDKKREAINKVKEKISNRKQKYNKQLDQGYLKEVENITSSVGFGEGSAAETVAELDEKLLKGKSKTEIKLLANKYDEQQNYEGKRILNDMMAKSDIPSVDLNGFQPVDNKINELDKYYKGKKRVVTDQLGAEEIRLTELKEEAGLI